MFRRGCKGSCRKANGIPSNRWIGYLREKRKNAAWRRDDKFHRECECPISQFFYNNIFSHFPCIPDYLVYLVYQVSVLPSMIVALHYLHFHRPRLATGRASAAQDVASQGGQVPVPVREHRVSDRDLLYLICVKYIVTRLAIPLLGYSSSGMVCVSCCTGLVVLQDFT